MRCPECNEETQGKKDNRNRVHCEYCYYILPLVEPEQPKPVQPPPTVSLPPPAEPAKKQPQRRGRSKKAN